MSTVEPLREFSAERHLRQHLNGGLAASGNAELLNAIEALRAEIAELRSGRDQAAATDDQGTTESSTETNESLAARVEIAQMVRMIGQAKLEIASIKHPMVEDDRMEMAANELDAIVMATETSTEAVLGASEEIENLVRKIAGLHPDDDDLVTLTDDIANQIIKIFEACNFQDITGQRINKVITTLRYIEERILAMIDIWGVDAFAELPIPEDERDGDASLLNGPQLANQGISQEDINALFD